MKRVLNMDGTLCRVVALIAVVLGIQACAAVPVDFTGHQADSNIRVQAGADQLTVRWLGSHGRHCEVVLSLEPGQPLVRSVGTMASASEKAEVILSDIDPVVLLTVGERDLDKRAGWVIFFDKVHTRPSKAYRADIELNSVRVRSTRERATIEVGDVTAGGFSGTLQLTVISGSSLLRVDQVLQTSEDGRAIVYDAGIVSDDAEWQRTTWMNSNDELVQVPTSNSETAGPLAVRFRTVAAEGGSGSVAIFPPPHQFFYPLDFADNFGFVWQGQDDRGLVSGRSMGVRQPLDGDRRYVPWFNAPPNTEQRLGVYWYLTPSSGKEAIEEVAAYTRGDHYPEIPGYQRMTSHYHVEHTLDYLKRQSDENSGIPKGLEDPGFVKTFKRIGADIVHLAEFHNGRTPRMKTTQRLQQLQLMHTECRRLSTERFLLLPGEEPNVHLGGHWLSFFPKPVNWVLNRPEGTPFVQEVDGFGRVYHVGSQADVLELMRRENGLMWTAHARIKSSTGYPDLYRETPFFQSDHFLGAAWKAMPADLSWRRLGKRVLGLMDDMANWGDPKYVLGEVDVFKVEPDYELFGHMNMNYLRLDQLPRYDEGWGSILDTLRKGQFFVTTGEILIPKFTVGGRESGETLQWVEGRKSYVAFDLDWTFPLAFAELVTGDGQSVYREEIDLSDRAEFGRDHFRHEVDLAGKKWLRLEVWDVASNGAFTQPVWIAGD